MPTEDLVEALMRASLEAASLTKPISGSPDTRAAYARGVRDMAALIHACIKVADKSREEHRDHPVVATMFTGYSRALQQLVDAAEELIPPGYEK
jgi:hypothetical protein